MSNKKTVSLQRVLEVAGQAFIDHRFEDVSVAMVAQAAHCSTATIYDVYGSKEKLYLCAMTQRLQDNWPPMIVPEGQSGLWTLMEVVHARVGSLSRPGSRAVTRAMSRQLEIMQQTLFKAMTDVRQKTTEMLSGHIRAALDEGSLRPLAVDLICYNVMAVSAYEATLMGMVYGITTPLSLRKIINNMFAPLVTERGEKILRQYLWDRLEVETSTS